MVSPGLSGLLDESVVTRKVLHQIKEFFRLTLLIPRALLALKLEPVAGFGLVLPIQIRGE
jgi:hypothetical protein